MKNNDEIIVYWGISEEGQRSSSEYMLEITEPQNILSLLKDFKTKVTPTDKNLANNILKCPAILSYSKNIFVVKCPLDINISIQNNEIVTIDRNQIFFDNHIKAHDVSTGFFQFKVPFFFFTEEESLKVRQSGSLYANTDIENKLHTICGEFDIGNWFRNFSAAYVCKEQPCNIKIQKNDPLYFLEFFTDKKIIFKQFYFNDDLLTCAYYCLLHKYNNNRLPILSYLTYIYDIFKKRQLKSRILKNIKNNLYTS